jgi:hypothetical protein
LYFQKIDDPALKMFTDGKYMSWHYCSHCGIMNMDYRKRARKWTHAFLYIIDNQNNMSIDGSYRKSYFKTHPAILINDLS